MLDPIRYEFEHASKKLIFYENCFSDREAQKKETTSILRELKYGEVSSLCDEVPDHILFIVVDFTVSGPLRILKL